jgi:hypothetical protein
MLPGLGQYTIAIIGACLLVGLVTIFGEKRTKEGKRPWNPYATIVIIIFIILIFIGYLIS